MVTSFDVSATEPPSAAVSSPLGYEFALLGLRARESRVDVIRAAAQRTAERIHEAVVGDPREQDQMLSELATSTYRLLDPRRRKKPLERIQLCIFSESDLEQQQSSREPLLGPRVDTDTTAVADVRPLTLREAQRDVMRILADRQRRDRHRVGAVALSVLGLMSSAAMLMWLAG